MTEPSQYFKGRTVQEQMDEVIGYVDKRAEEVAAAKADDVLQPAEAAKTAAQTAAQEAEAAKNTTIVVTMVLIDTALRPHSFVTATVTMEAVAICTILVQISRVLMALSKSSRINSAVFALASPRSAAAFTRLLGQEA